MGTTGIRSLISAYPVLTLRDRLHMRIRWRVCPLPAIAAHVPDHGTIIDLGCGHGLFTQMLAREAPRRGVIGIDLDARKIALAQQLTNTLPNLRFRVGDVAAIDTLPAQAVTILDVLYLVPYEAQEHLLAVCAQKLAPMGVIVLKEMAERPRWKVWCNLLEETLAVRVLRLTLGDKFYFRSCADWQALFRKLGFAVETVPLDHGYYHPHVLFIAKKQL